MKPPAWLRGEIRWLISAQGVRMFSLSIPGVAISLYAAAAGESTIEVGTLLTLCSLGTTAMVLLVGLYGDRVGRRRTLIALSLLAGAGMTLMAFSANFWVLAIAASLSGVGASSGVGITMSGPTLPPTQALLADRCRPADRNAAFTGLFFASVIASALGALVAGLAGVLHAHGMGALAAYRPPFLIGVASSLATVPFLLRVTESRSSGATRPSKEALRLIGKLFVTNGLTGVALGVMGPFLTYWFHLRYGVGPEAVGALYAMANVTIAVSSVAGAPLARRLGAVRTISGSRFAVSFWILAMTVAPTFPLAGLCLLLRFVSGSAAAPLRQSYVMGVSDERSRATVAAFGNLPSQLTSSAAPALSAYLVEAVGFDAPLWVAAAAQLGNAAAYWWMFRNLVPPEERRGPPSEPTGGS